MKNKLKEHLRTMLFMALLSAISAGGVSTAYVMTKDRIKTNDELARYRAVLHAAGMPVPESADDAWKIFRDKVREFPGGIYQIEGAMLAIESRSAGLWGPIDAVVCFDESLETMRGISFTYQNETPGLGGRIEEEWFTEQFRGKRPPLKISQDALSSTPQTFDAITGATISCTAVERLVNDARARLNEIIHNTRDAQGNTPGAR